LVKVDEFFERTKNLDKTEQEEYKVESFAARKLLAREISIKYKGLDNIYTEYKKGSDIFVIKRWKKRYYI
jgi:hypothetical protein